MSAAIPVIRYQGPRCELVGRICVFPITEGEEFAVLRGVVRFGKRYDLDPGEHGSWTTGLLKEAERLGGVCV